MELQPKDLGLRRYARTLYARAYPLYAQMGTHSSGGEIAAQIVRRADDLARDAMQEVRSLGKNQRGSGYMHFLAHGLGLPPAVERRLAGPTSGLLGGIIGGIGGGVGGGFLGPSIAMFATHDGFIPGMIFATIGATGVAVSLLVPRGMVRKWAKTPIGTPEIETFRRITDDPVELAYLDLLRDITQYEPPSAETERRLREAVTTLADTIDSLPFAQAAADNRTALETEAAEARQRLAEETDPVVAESLRRRLDAQHQALRSAERSEQQSRRALALREELIAQMRALRLSLAEGGETRNSLTALAGLADSLRPVTIEADSAAQARAELDAATENSAWHTVTPTATETKTEQKVVRRGH